MHNQTKYVMSLITAKLFSFVEKSLKIENNFQYFSITNIP